MRFSKIACVLKSGKLQYICLNFFSNSRFTLTASLHLLQLRYANSSLAPVSVVVNGLHDEKRRGTRRRDLKRESLREIDVNQRGTSTENYGKERCKIERKSPEKSERNSRHRSFGQGEAPTGMARPLGVATVGSQRRQIAISKS